MQRNGFSIEPADPLADKEVLALAAQAWPEAERAFTWQSVRSAAEAEPASVCLLAARRGEQLLAAIVSQTLPGRAAVVWPPQFAAANLASAEVSGEMLRELTAVLGSRGVQVAQSLLGRGDSPPVESLAAGGFWRGAELLFLAAEASGFPLQPPELPFELMPSHSASESRLIELIDRTYQGTLDCPRLDGMRTTADVVCGHRAVGFFRPDLWLLARAEGREIGCLLVNLHPDVKHAELVYLGLVPEVRGRGYGRLLTQHALWLARQEKCDRLVLAVDAANGPALAAYRAAGLSIWDRRTIWIWPPEGGAKAEPLAT